MNKKFSAEVLKLLPEFGAVDLYFYRKPANHILCGFVCERSLSGAYIWRYVFPLYDRSSGLSLRYGIRLPAPNGFMEVVGRKEMELAAEFVSQIGPFRAEVESLAGLKKFANYLEVEYIKTGIVSGNPRIRRGFALTLLMLGRKEEAAKEIETLCLMDDVKKDPNAMADLRKLLDDLSSGIEFAKKTLDEWEVETKQNLGITLGLLQDSAGVLR